jgi:hypothetical protein
MKRKKHDGPSKVMKRKKHDGPAKVKNVLSVKVTWETKLIHPANNDRE